MSLEDAVRTGMAAHDDLHGACEAEIARLRAEVERLKGEIDTYDDIVSDLKRERDEALAQLAVCVEALQVALNSLCASIDYQRVPSNRMGIKAIKEVQENMPVAARALLTRLERVERAAAVIQRKCEQYWNAPALDAPEFHAVLEFIHQAAAWQEDL